MILVCASGHLRHMRRLPRLTARAASSSATDILPGPQAQLLSVFCSISLVSEVAPVLPFYITYYTAI